MHCTMSHEIAAFYLIIPKIPNSQGLSGLALLSFFFLLLHRNGVLHPNSQGQATTGH